MGGGAEGNFVVVSQSVGDIQPSTNIKVFRVEMTAATRY